MSVHCTHNNTCDVSLLRRHHSGVPHLGGCTATILSGKRKMAAAMLFIIVAVILSAFDPLPLSLTTGALATPPASCASNPTAFTALQTLTFDPTDSSEANANSRYTVSLASCRYNAGIRIAASGTARTPIYHATLVISDVTTTTINFDTSVLFATGSSVTVLRTTISSGLLYSYMSLTNGASLLLQSLTMSSALMISSATVTEGSTITLDDVKITTSATVALQVNSVTFRNAAVIIRNSNLRSTSTAASSFGLQWVNSPMHPSAVDGNDGSLSELTVNNNTITGGNGLVLSTQNDWVRCNQTRVTITNNKIQATSTTTSVSSLKVFVHGHPSYAVRDNTITGGVVDVLHLAPTNKFRFSLASSSVYSIVYKYANLLNTSNGDSIIISDVVFAATTTTRFDLPTTSNSTIRFLRCRSTVASAIAIAYRSLNVGELTFDGGNIVGATTVTTTFLSYKMDFSLRNTSKFSGCVNMKFYEMYFSTVNFDGASIGCTQLEGQLFNSRFIMNGSTVNPAAASVTAVVNFLNDWTASTIDILNSSLSTGTYAYNHRIVLFTGKVIDKTMQRFVGNTFTHSATSGQSGIVPRSCIVGYSRKSNMPAYASLNAGSSLEFSGGNRATMVTRDTYLLYLNVQGGDFIWDESNSARGSAAGIGRYYLNVIAPSEDSVAVQLRNFINFFQIDIVRYLAVNPSTYETISVRDSSSATVYIYVHTAVGLNVTLDNVTATKNINFQGVNIASSAFTFNRVTTATLFQSITTLTTSTFAVTNSRPNLMQHYVTAFDGCVVQFISNVLPTSHFRLKGGVYDSQLLIQNNTITSANAYSLWLDGYTIRQSPMDIINNTLITSSTGTTYGMYWLKTSATAGVTITVWGNTISKHTHAFHAVADFRHGCVLKFANNNFATTAVSGFILRFNITGARFIHEDSNKYHMGRIYIYHYTSSFGNYFAMRNVYNVQNPARFEWVYYSAGHSAVKDTIDLNAVYFTALVNIQFPMANDVYVRFNQVRATTVNVHHRQANVSTVVIDGSTTTSYISLSTTNGCVGCSFSILNTTSARHLQFSGAATDSSVFTVRGTTATYLICASAFARFSGLRLLSSTIEGTRTPTIQLSGGWTDSSFLLIDSCRITGNYRAVAISSHTTNNSTHTVTNNVMSTILTSSYYPTITPAYGILVYTRSIYTSAPNAAGIGFNATLTILNNTFGVRYTHSYVLHVTSNNGGRVVMDNGNVIRPTPATSNFGRIYVNSVGTHPDGPSSLGHKIVLTNQPRFYYFHIARQAGTISYNEQFELHNSTVAYAYVYAQDSHNLKVYFSQLTMLYDAYVYGATATGASITLRGIAGRNIYHSSTSMVTSFVDFIGNTFRGTLYHSAISSAESLTTIRNNSHTGAKFIQVRGALLNSQLMLDRNRVTTTGAQALLVDALTLRMAVFYASHNEFRATASAGVGVNWKKSPAYLCSDVIFFNSTLYGYYSAFDMITQDIGSGAQLWFRNTSFQAGAASRWAFRLTMGAGGRFDIDGTNIVRAGIARVYHTYHTSRNNVLLLSRQSALARLEWLYSAANGTSHNDTIAVNGATVAGYANIDIPAAYNTTLNISNTQFTSYILIKIKRGHAMNAVVHGCVVGTYVSFKPASGVSLFSNSTIGVINSRVTTTITITGNYGDSTAYVRNSTGTAISTSGQFNKGSALIIDRANIQGSVNHAGNIDSIFEDATLLVENSTFSSTSYKAFVITRSTKGSTRHIFTNNYFYAGEVSTYYTVSVSPRFCAFCYAIPSGGTAATIAGPGAGNASIAVFRGNRFSVRSASNAAYLAYITTGENGKVYFDETNYNVPYAISTTAYGYYRFGFTGKTSPGNFVNVSARGNRIFGLMVDHSGTATDDTIVLANTLSVGRIAVTYNVADNVTVLMRDTTVASYAVTMYGTNIRKNSLFELRNVTTTYTITFRMRMIGSSMAVVRNSNVALVSYMVRALDYSKFVFDRNLFNSFSTDSAALSVVETNGELHITNNTAQRNSVTLLDMEDLIVRNFGKVRIANNMLVSTATATYIYSYFTAIYWILSPISDNGEVFILNNTMYCQYGFWMETWSNLLPGGTMWFRNNTITTRAAGYFGLSAKINGGRIDHDASNKYTSGGVEIIHYAHSRNNVFVLANSVLGIDFDIRYNLATYNATNDVYMVRNCVMTLSVMSLPRMTNTTVLIDRVTTTTGALTITSTYAEKSQLLITNSIIKTAATVAVTVDASRCIVGVENTTVTTLLTLNTQLVNNSALYVKRSTIGALAVQGVVRNASVVVHDSDFNSFSSASVVTFSSTWYDAFLEFARNRILSVVVSRSVTIASPMYGATVHRFLNSTIINRGTAAQTSVPGACALCYCSIASSGTVPSIPANASVTVRNMTLQASLATAYLLYVVANGGVIDIDSNNLAKGVTNDVGSVYVGLGAQSSNTRVTLANMGSLNAVEVVRLTASPAAVGLNESIIIQNMTAVTARLSLGIIRNAAVQITNVTAKTSFTLLSTNTEATNVTIQRTSSATVLLDLDNMTASNLIMNNTQNVASLSMTFAARSKSTFHVANTVITAGTAALSAGGLYDNSVFIFEDNQIASATASAHPFSITTFISENSLQYYRNNVLRLTAAGSAFYYASGVAKNSLFYFDNNTFGSLVTTTGTSTNGFYLNAYVFGEGTEGVFRRNIFYTPTVSSVAFRALLTGGSVDLDGSNSVRKGSFVVIHSAASTGNRVVVLNAEISYFSYTHSTKTHRSDESQIVLDNVKMTSTTANLLTFGVCERCLVRASRISTNGHLTLTSPQAINSDYLLEVITFVSTTADLTITGDATMNSKIRIQNATVNDAVVITTGATTNSEITISRLRNGGAFTQSISAVQTVAVKIEHCVNTGAMTSSLTNIRNLTYSVTNTTSSGALTIGGVTTVGDSNFKVVNVTASAFDMDLPTFQDSDILAENITALTGDFSIDIAGAARNGSVRMRFVRTVVGAARLTATTATTNMWVELVNASVKGTTTMTLPATNNSMILMRRNAFIGDVGVTTTLSTYTFLWVDACSFNTASLTLYGAFNAGRRTLISDAVFVSDVIAIPASASRNALVEIVRTTMAHTSTLISLTGLFSDDAKVSIRDSRLTATSTALGVYQTQRVPHFSMINTYVTTVTGVALRISITGTAFVTKSLEIIGNEFAATSSGGSVNIITDKAINSVVITNNKFKATALTVPVDVAPYSRFTSCNVDTTNAAVVPVGASLTDVACGTAIPRCVGMDDEQTFTPSSYTRGASMVVGAADTFAPECAALLRYVPSVTDAGSLGAPNATLPIAIATVMPLLNTSSTPAVPSPLPIPTLVLSAFVAAARARADELSEAWIALRELTRLTLKRIATTAAPTFADVAVSFYVPQWRTLNPFAPVTPTIIPTQSTMSDAQRWNNLSVANTVSSQPIPKVPIPSRLATSYLLEASRPAIPCMQIMETTTPPPTTFATTFTLDPTTIPTTTLRPTVTDPPTTTLPFTTPLFTHKPTTTALVTTMAAYSEIFSDDGLDEPITTPEDTNSYAIPDDTQLPSNSDVATIPGRFTLPPISEDMVPVSDDEPASSIAEPTAPVGPTFPEPNDSPPSAESISLPPDPTYTLPASLTEAPYVEPSDDDDDGWFPSQDVNTTSSEGFSDGGGGGGGGSSGSDVYSDDSFSDYSGDDYSDDYPSDNGEPPTDPPETNATETDEPNTTVAPPFTYPDGSPLPTDTNGVTVTVPSGATETNGNPIPSHDNGVPAQTDENGNPITYYPTYTYPDGTLLPTDDYGQTITVPSGATETNGNPIPSHDNGVPAQTDENGNPITYYPTYTYPDGTLLPTDDYGQTITVPENATQEDGRLVPTDDGAIPAQTDENGNAITYGTRDPNATTVATNATAVPSTTPTWTTGLTAPTTNANETSDGTSNDTNATTTDGIVWTTEDPNSTTTDGQSNSSTDDGNHNGTTSAPPATADPTGHHRTRTPTLTPEGDVTRTIPLAYICPTILMTVPHPSIAGEEITVSGGAPSSSAQHNNATAARSTALRLDAERLQGGDGFKATFTIDEDGEPTRVRFAAPSSSSSATVGNASSSSSSSSVVFAVLSVAKATVGIKAVGSFADVFGSSVRVPCTIVTTTRIDCTLEPRGAYNPPKEEVLRITLPSDVFEVACEDTTVAFTAAFNVAALVEGNAANEAAAGVAGVASGATGAAGLLAGAAAFDAYVLGMLLNSPCASEADHEKSKVMMYIIAPFKDYGNAAMVFGNLGIAGGFAALQFGMAWHIKTSRRIATLEAFAAVYFPSFSYIVAELMYTGVAIGAFSAVNADADDGKGVADYVAAAVGIIALMLIPGSIFYTLLKVVNPRFHMYTQFLSRKWYRRLFFPQTFVRTEVQRRAFNRHVAPFAGDTKSLFGTFTMPTILLSSAILYLLPASVSCGVKLWLFTVVLIGTGVMLAIARPYRYDSETIFIVVALGLLSLLSAIMAVQYDNNSSELETAQIGIALLIFLFIIFRVVINLTTMVLEYKYWRHFQEQIANDLDEDLFNLKRDSDDVYNDDGEEGFLGGGIGHGEELKSLKKKPLAKKKMGAGAAAAVSAPPNDSFSINMALPVKESADDLLDSSASSLSDDFDEDEDEIYNSSGGTSGATTPRRPNSAAAAVSPNNNKHNKNKNSNAASSASGSADDLLEDSSSDLSSEGGSSSSSSLGDSDISM